MPYGSLLADVVQSSATGTPPQFNDTTGTQVGTLCRAWVNFNGTGSVAIRASFNVSSITDNGTGDYTVNFTTAMPDANYSAQVWAATTGSTGFFVGTQQSTTAPTASALRLVTRNNSQVANDLDYVQVAIFR